ncbi:MAG TPA: TetR/AcrR family transcriptional regulator [Streptosporangiaceae bacterium]|jgi:AcrR family transcriptional regulator|nr:TetR/AcrR family transcriptional regulator [Streptosporangiaceae bacterium]
MELNSEAVNSRRRRYDSTGRRERARQARDQIVGIAEDLFLSEGYAATTVAAIAARAQVSVETIYKGFGGKPGLVRAIIEKGLAGRGPVPAEQRSDRIRDTEPDPRRILTAWGEFAAEIAPRTAPILLLARDAAAADPELAALLEEVSAARLERMTVNARGLHEAGHLRPGLSVAEAADIMWTYSSAEFWELLVLHRGWSPERHGRFVAQALIAALLPPEPGQR